MSKPTTEDLDKMQFGRLGLHRRPTEGNGAMALDISDHALVRYIERIKGESLDKYRDEIRALLSEHKGRSIPDSGYDDGILFVLEPIRDCPTVVTVLLPAWRPKRRRPWTTRTLVHVPLRQLESAAVPHDKCSQRT